MAKDKVAHPPAAPQNSEGTVRQVNKGVIKGPTAGDNLNPYNRSGKK